MQSRAYAQLMYAALIWAKKVLQNKHFVRKLIAVQRLCTLRMISAYDIVGWGYDIVRFKNT